MKDPYQVINSLMYTEKSTSMEPERKYLFWVQPQANKIEIKKAVEDVYKVKVDKVNTIKMHGKARRVRYRTGKTSDWKKAIVTLKEGYKIEVA